MGVGSFAISRFLDMVIPGAGVALDILEAMQIIHEGIEAGDIAEATGEQLLDQLENDKRRGVRTVSSDRVHAVVRRCGICRQPGHNRRTCSRR
jgi:hypothetical protein